MTTRNSTRQNNSLIIRLIFIAVLIYLSTVGATFNGILALPETMPVTLAIFGLSAGAWLLRYWLPRAAEKGKSSGRQTWYATPLDGVFVLWGAAFAISMLANGETWRRSIEALWYMGLYVAIWYLLSDLLARGMRRSVITGALLVSGIIILIFGYIQIIHQLNTLGFSGGIPRPSSLIGNPNALAAFLVVIVPLALVQAALAKTRLIRMVMALYTLAALGLLLATFSRGAWMGIAAALLLAAVLLLRHYDLLSVGKLRAWFSGRGMWIKAALTISAVIALAGCVLMAVLLVGSFSDSGRGVGLRTYLWDAGLMLFGEKPLTGYGLFNFGRYLARFSSIPPNQPLSHAHNLPINIAAELGIPGLLALVVTVFVVLHQIRRSDADITPDDRAAWVGSIAAMVGFGVHHLLDIPAMMPLIALTGILILAVAAAPATPQPITNTVRKTIMPLLITALWIVLLMVGFWNSGWYQDYYRTLENAGVKAEYRPAAEHLQSIIDADPRQPAYLLEQAYLYGLAASKGDDDANAAAIVVYQRYLELEPSHATAWANLAALAWQQSDDALAVDAIDKAIALAPAFSFAVQHDLYTGKNAEFEDYELVESPWALNLARFEYLREVLDRDFLPQIGWGHRR